MSVNVEVRCNWIDKLLSIEKIAEMANLSYGYINNDLCLVHNKVADYSVLYDSAYICRGFEVWKEDNKICFRLPLPTSIKEIEQFYYLIEKVCSMVNDDTIYYENLKVSIKDKDKFIKENVEASLQSLKQIEKEILSGQKDNIIIFGAYNPISIGVNELKEINGRLKGLGDLLNRLQQKDVYYANCRYYQRSDDNSVFGMYFVSENCYTVLPLKPEEILKKIDNLTDYYVRIPDDNNIIYDDFIKNVKKIEDYDCNHIVCLLDSDTISYLADNYNVNVLTNEREKGSYFGTQLDNGRDHSYKIEDLLLPLNQLAGYNHIAVFLRWMVEHDFISEQLSKEIPNLKEIVNDSTIDLREFISSNKAFNGGIKTHHFKEEIIPFVKKFYQFNNKDGYPSCVDKYALEVLGKDKYNCPEYKDEAYLFVPYDENYYLGLSKYIDKAYDNYLKQIRV